MDTRFWGPSGWKLLHLVAASPVHNKEAMTEWIRLLPYVLPCKYCRASLQEYYETAPPSLESPEKFSHWMFTIHNMVNAKLRSQGLLKTPNPQWSSVRKQYKEMSDSLCSTSPIVGWDFFASVAYTTPTRGVKSTPFNLPAELRGVELSMETKNRYNLLTTRERLSALKGWWELIPSILPCPAWRRAWVVCEPPLEKGRDAVSCWLWDLEETACSTLRCPTAHESLPNLKTELAAFESKCGTSTKKKTCRTRRNALRKAVMTRRVMTRRVMTRRQAL